MKVSFAEHFIAHQQQHDQSDRLNTAILDETFQMTVRNHRIFDNKAIDYNDDYDINDEKEIFKTAKDELELLSDDEDSPEEDKTEGKAQKRPSIVLIDDH